jgi:hypothetical protein
MKKKSNQIYHVYILYSASQPNMVKVGKANNLKRVPYFNLAGYAGITDWIQALSIPTSSNEAALAIEAMIAAKLINHGYKREKIMWSDLLVKDRIVGATECYNCTVDYAIAEAISMANLYFEYIAK